MNGSGFGSGFGAITNTSNCSTGPERVQIIPGFDGAVVQPALDHVSCAMPSVRCMPSGLSTPIWQCDSGFETAHGGIWAMLVYIGIVGYIFLGVAILCDGNPLPGP